MIIRTCLLLLAGVYALQLTSFAVLSGILIVALPLYLMLQSRVAIRDAACLVAGAVLFAFATLQQVSERLAPEFAGDSMLVQLQITEFPIVSASSVAFIAAPVSDSRIPPRIRVSWFEPPVNLQLGDVWQVELRLRRPRGNSNPGVFDYEAWMFRERIAATGYVVRSKRNHLLQSGELDLVGGIRQRVADRLTELLSDRDSAAVLAAISVGARHLMSQQQWDRYARTGTGHLMAISGLHIGLVAALAYTLVLIASGLAGWRGNHRDIAVIVSLLAAIGYAWVSGYGIPARRASLMLALVVVAYLRRRQISPLLILCGTCCVVVMLDPVATMAPGFKLSFAAVLVLIWFARWRVTATQSHWIYRPLQGLRSLVGMQIVLLLGLLPLSVLIFQRVAFMAPLANLVAVPVFSFVTVPLTLVGLLFTGPLQSLGDPMLLLAADSIGLLEWGIEKAASVPVTSAKAATVTGFAWVLLLLPLLAVIIPPGWPGRYLAWIAVAALLLHKPAGPPPGCADVAVLDVGQGLSVVVRTHRHVLLFDTGAAFRQGGSMADRIVLPYLAGLGVRRIDRLLISHADNDHAGGTRDILEAVDVDRLLVGEALPDIARISQRCVAPMAWHWDGIVFQVLHPGQGELPEGNDASCVVVVTAGNTRLLLTGDIEKATEHQLLQSGTLPSAAAVVVPHHGSRTSSTSPFVAAVRPAVAVVSAGFDNQWGFPKKEVVDRWQRVGAEVLKTAASGMVGLRLCEESGLETVTEHRKASHRIWHER